MPFDFAALENDWADAKAPETTSSEPPDGKYTVRVHKVELKETQPKNGEDKGHVQLKWQCVIEGGPQNGRYLFRNNQLTTKQNLSWLRKDLETCGVVLAKLSDLEANLPKLLDKRLSVKKVTKGDFYNLYIDKAISDSSTSPASGPTSGPGKDGLPF